jgi:CheY-like chemotaxis protein
VGRGGYFSIDSLQGIYVLVVDQEPRSAALLTSIFRYASAFVVSVREPHEALETMRHVKPDALVVDVASSRDDEALMSAVRALNPEAGGVMPAVAIAAHADQRDRLADAGFSAIVVAPFDPWELCRLVATLTFVP